MGGRDKARLLLPDGRTILQVQLDLLRDFGEVALVGGNPEPGVHHLGDFEGGLGPLDGLAAALTWCPTEWLVLVASDQPFLRAPALDLLLEGRREGAQAVVAQLQAGVQPMPGIYRKSALAEVERRLQARELRLRSLLEEGSALEVVRVEEAALLAVDPELATYKNLNRPEDLPLN
jgi:molybdopterin-guanine dinucleotide biosynthesis protein A